MRARNPPFHTIAAAEGKDVTIGGGASTAQQYLRGADFVDELTVHVVRVLLGGGERLFDRLLTGPRSGSSPARPRRWCVSLRCSPTG